MKELMMKLRQLLALIFLSSSLLFADNFHNQLIIPSVAIHNPYWEFAGQAISQKEEGAFAQLVEKWNDTLDELWRNLNHKIREDIHASTKQLDYYMEEKLFVDVYVNYYKKVYAEIIENNEVIDPIVLDFIQLKLCYLQCNKPVKIYMLDNMPLPSLSFGADKSEHYLILNTDIYNAENIQYVYELASKNISQFYIAPHTNLHKSRAIEHSNLLHLGITQALSSIIHQGDYFSKLLQYFIYNQKSISKDIQIYGAYLIEFRSFLEACLQSKNPLEAAIFLEPYLDNFNQEFILLWRDFIDDITNCYNADDLNAYETLSLKERRAALYTDLDDNDE